MLESLEIDLDFAKKVAIPAVTNLQELNSALSISKFVTSTDARSVVERVHQYTGSEQVGIGIKTVLDVVFEARTGRQGGPEVVETLTDLLVEKIQDKRF